MAKSLQQLKDETTRLRDQLRDAASIDLDALRQFWKDLDDGVHQGSAGIFHSL